MLKGVVWIIGNLQDILSELKTKQSVVVQHLCLHTNGVTIDI